MDSESTLGLEKCRVLAIEAQSHRYLRPRDDANWIIDEGGCCIWYDEPDLIKKVPRRVTSGTSIYRQQSGLQCTRPADDHTSPKKKEKENERDANKLGASEKRTVKISSSIKLC